MYIYAAGNDTTNKSIQAPLSGQPKLDPNPSPFLRSFSRQNRLRCNSLAAAVKALSLVATVAT